MQIRLVSLLAALAATLALSAAQADEAAIRKALIAKFPKAQVTGITKLPYLNLYDVIVDG